MGMTGLALDSESWLMSGCTCGLSYNFFSMISYTHVCILDYKKPERTVGKVLQPEKN